MEYLLKTEEDTKELAYKMAKENIKCILLDGDLGAGKTTFTKYYAKALGEQREVNSPTYSIVKEYDDFYHFDLYRITDLEELYDIDFDSYIFSNKKIVIEWPYIAKEFLTQTYTMIKIRNKEDIRKVEVIYDFSF